MVLEVTAHLGGDFFVLELVEELHGLGLALALVVRVQDRHADAQLVEGCGIRLVTFGGRGGDGGEGPTEPFVGSCGLNFPVTAEGRQSCRGVSTVSVRLFITLQDLLQVLDSVCGRHGCSPEHGRATNGKDGQSNIQQPTGQHECQPSTSNGQRNIHKCVAGSVKDHDHRNGNQDGRKDHHSEEEPTGAVAALMEVVVVVSAAATVVPGVADVSVDLSFDFGAMEAGGGFSGGCGCGCVAASVVTAKTTEPGSTSTFVGLTVPGVVRVVTDGLALLQWGGGLGYLRDSGGRSEWGGGEKSWLLKLLRGLSREA